MKRSFAWLLVAGCGPAIDVLDARTTTSTSASTIDSSTPDPTMTIPTTTPDPESTPDNGDGSLLVFPDAGGSARRCSLWSNDCPIGEKCMAWWSDEYGGWNELHCSPVAADPKAVGEPCTLVDSGVTGIDDCVPRAMCWNVDPETNLGTCVAMCEGTESNPTCVDPCTHCNISDGTVLILCLPSCDPLAQDCLDGQGCYAINDRFACAPDVSADAGLAGDPCALINVCDAGNFCASPDTVPGCEGAKGCCAPFCDASAADGCDALLPGTSCVPWFGPGEAPGDCIGTGIIGACLVAG